MIIALRKFGKNIKNPGGAMEKLMEIQPKYNFQFDLVLLFLQMQESNTKEELKQKL